MTTRRTALITGASSGIGAAFARQFAARGHDLVLVARRRERLADLAAELQGLHGISVTTIPADLSVPTAPATIEDELQRASIRLDVLVNCAGVGKTQPFMGSSDEDAATQIGVNVLSLVELTRRLLPQLVASDRGVLINVASLTGSLPSPGMAVYSATKAFVLHFTEALWGELRGTQVRVLVVSPGPTSSEFYDVSNSSTHGVRFQTPDQVVATAMGAIDDRRDKPSVTSGRLNAMVVGLTRLLPRRALVLISLRNGTADDSAA